LAQRDIARMMSKFEDTPLFEFQKVLVKRNKIIIDLESKKFHGIKARASRFLVSEKLPSLSSEVVNISAIESMAHCRGQFGKPALRPVLDLLEKRPDDVGVLLTAVQLLTKANNIAPAIPLVESFSKRLERASDTSTTDVRFSPGVVALIVALHSARGGESSAKTELTNAAQYWRQRGSDGARAMSLLREAGLRLVKSLKPSELVAAGESFEALREQGSRDPLLGAGLVAAFATVDPGKISEQLDELPSADSLTGNIAVEDLINSGVAMVNPTGLHAKKRGPDEGVDEKMTMKKRRRKLPKNYEEGKTMDPERWLPLRDRSSYRPKGKKGKKKAIEATQGGFVKEEETLRLVGDAGAVRVERAPIAGASAKKKKKGKK
jgi:signal recognition particle subunit SRP72